MGAVIGTIFKAIWAIVQIAWSNIQNYIIPAVVLIWNVISSNFQRIWSIASTVFNAVKTVIVNVWGQIKQVIGTIVSVVSVVVSTFQRIYSAIGDKVTAAINFVKSFPRRSSASSRTPPPCSSARAPTSSADCSRGICNKASEITDTIRTWITDKIPAKVRELMGIASPAKVMIPLGANIVDGVIVGIRSSSEALSSALGASFNPRPSSPRSESNRDSLLAAVDKSIKAVEKKYAKNAKKKKSKTNALNSAKATLNAMAANTIAFVNEQSVQLNAAATQVDTYRAALAKAQEDRATKTAERIQSVRTRATSRRSSAKAPTSTPCSRVSAKAATTAENFNADFTTAIGRGISQQTINELVAGGAGSQAKVAKILANATDEQLATIKAQQDRLGVAGQRFAEIGNKYFAEAGQQTADGLVSGLEAELPRAIAVAEQLATSMVNAVKAKLGIKSPSRVFAAIGDNIAQGVTLGIERSGADTLDAVTGIVAAPALAARNFQLSGAGSGAQIGSGATNNFYIEAAPNIPTEEQIMAAQRRAELLQQVAI